MSTQEQPKVARALGSAKPKFPRSRLLLVPLVLFVPFGLHQLVGYRTFYVPSTSMAPTLTIEHQDRFRAEWMFSRLTPPKRGDIWVFRAPPEASPEEKEFLQRVVGLPGDTVEIVPPRILVDGMQVVRMTSESDTEGVLQVTRTSTNTEVEQNRVRIEAIMPSYVSAEVTLMAAPDTRIEADGYQVLVGGKVELEDSLGRIRPENSLQSYGWDPKVKGTVFSIDGEPRLAVLQGSRLTLDPGHVVIKNTQGETRLVEPYIQEAPRYAFLPKKLGPHEYFVLGDNRNNSNDSHVWGPLKRERMVARAHYRFWPPHRVGFL